MAKKSPLGRKLDKANARITALEADVLRLNRENSAQRQFNTAAHAERVHLRGQVRRLVEVLRSEAERVEPVFPHHARMLHATADAYAPLPVTNADIAPEKATS